MKSVKLYLRIFIILFTRTVGNEVLAKGEKSEGKVDTVKLAKLDFERNPWRERFGEEWKPPTPPTGPQDLFRLAKEWVPYSDCIVIGKVEKIESHPEGPYHTWVIIEAEKYLKGGLKEKEVMVKLISGKVKRGKFGEKTDGIGISSEPKFREGEKVLVFLTTIPNTLYIYYSRVQREVEKGLIPTHPHPEYKDVVKCEGFFERVSNYLKFEIVNEKVLFGSNQFTSRGIIPTKGVEIADLSTFIKEISSVSEKTNDE